MDKSKARCNAFDKAVNLLAFKGRTVQEIKTRLKENGYSSLEIESAVDKLIYYGYLNDKNYTISYMRDNASRKGKKLITQELKNKGIHKDIIYDCCDFIEFDDVGAIDKIMARRYNSANLSDEKEVRKIIAYFMRRGFEYSAIKQVLRKYKCEYEYENY